MSTGNITITSGSSVRIAAMLSAPSISITAATGITSTLTSRTLDAATVSLTNMTGAIGSENRPIFIESMTVTARTISNQSGSVYLRADNVSNLLAQLTVSALPAGTIFLYQNSSM